MPETCTCTTRVMCESCYMGIYEDGMQAALEGETLEIILERVGIMRLAREMGEWK